jgi:fructoselysine-6-P-deglycase FrlB-like protein
MDTAAIRSLLEPDKPCPFCGWEEHAGELHHRIHVTTKRVGAKTNVGWLLRRTFLAIERKEALQSCRTILQSASGNAFAVGTGGSFPVAVFLSHLFAEYGRLFVQPVRPFDYLRSRASVSHVFVVSYSGSTADCGEVICDAKARGVKSIILVTRASKPKLGELLDTAADDVVVSYGRKMPGGDGVPMERGFVSISGTVTPCALWTAAAVGSFAMAQLARELDSMDDEKLRSAAERMASALKANPHQPIPVFGGGFAWPAMFDIESKFVEGGLGNVQFHEVKDFSHGRFISVMSTCRESTALFLLVGNPHPYEMLLLESLPRNRVITIQSHQNGIVGALELLIRVQFFIQLCGEKLGKDISRPTHLPREGLRLYHWNQGLGRV